jgi:hypothetical protein
MENLNLINMLKFSPRGGEISSVADQVAANVEDGYSSALELLIGCRSIQKTIDAIIERIEQKALEEAQLEAKRFTRHGATIEVRELGTKYNFDNCNDPILERLATNRKFAADAEKDRQALLKTLRGKTEMLDTETGEIINALPPIKTSKTGIVITL